MKTILMSPQSLYHSFPITHTKTCTLTKPPPFKFPPTHSSFIGKGNTNSKPFPNLSERYAYCVIKSHNKDKETTVSNVSNHDTPEGFKSSNFKLIVVAASIGFALVLMGQDKAWALGPEGPLVEEFWENVRRYALYALTVSTGVIYTVVQPIIELLKNPISAVLILIIIGGSFFIVSQILSAMVGVSEFSYEYAY